MKAMATNQTISWFFQRTKENTLELAPPFQRNSVWKKTHKQELIDTILLNLPIPEVYLVNRVTIEGLSEHVVVDGQQRIRTILEFIFGEVTLRGSIKDRHGFSCFEDMPDIKKHEFWRYPIVIRDLEDSTDPEIRDLFQRLNRNTVSLNGQELRNAKFDGEYIHVVEQLADLHFWMDNHIFTANDIRRMKDIEYVSILLSLLIGGIQDGTRKLDEFYEMYNEEFEEKDRYITRFNSILNIITQTIPNFKSSRWSNKPDLYTLFSVYDILLDNKFALDKNITQVSEIISEFEKKVSQVKVNGSGEKRYFDYHEASVAGTNHKTSRLTRTNNLLDEFRDKFDYLKVN